MKRIATRQKRVSESDMGRGKINKSNQKKFSPQFLSYVLTSENLSLLYFSISSSILSFYSPPPSSPPLPSSTSYFFFRSYFFTVSLRTSGFERDCACFAVCVVVLTAKFVAAYSCKNQFFFLSLSLLSPLFKIWEEEGRFWSYGNLTCEYRYFFVIAAFLLFLFLSLFLFLVSPFQTTRWWWWWWWSPLSY